jgi:hypothetical protein
MAPTAKIIVLEYLQKQCWVILNKVPGCGASSEEFYCPFSISGLFKFASRNSHLTITEMTTPQATATVNTVTGKTMVLPQYLH